MARSGKITLLTGTDFNVDDVEAIKAAMEDDEARTVTVTRAGGAEVTIKTDAIAYVE